MYRLTVGGVSRLSDGAVVPDDEGNRDWRDYQKWLSAGNQPEPAPVPPIVIPDRVPAGDFVTALYQLGWLGDVKAAIAAAGGLAEELWLHASTFERGHPLVAQIGAAIGKTSADLDELFLLADEIGHQ